VGVPLIYGGFPEWFRTVMDSGISTGCVTAIALNVPFNHLPGKTAAGKNGARRATG
jgi:NCS2 family nucleobase:cation symporter-2